MGKKTAAANKFSVGDVVEWTSQANGSSLKKIGTVVEVVPATKSTKATPLPLGTRDHESYIVEVTFAPKRSTSAIKNVRVKKPKRYWPRVSVLRKSRFKAVHA
jgi:hypothetical protein